MSSSSSPKKILTVFGATGNQGGSVINAVLAHPKLSQEYSIRAITRDVTKPSAVKLQSLGVEVVTADMTSIPTLLTALRDSHAVFAVTNAWERASYEIELQQGRNMADAASQTPSVKHYIWSTLSHVKKLSKGKFTNVFHFDAKAEIADYIRQLGLPATFWHAGMYMNNLENLRPSSGESGEVLTLSFPFPSSTRAPLLDAAEDSGKFIAAILLSPQKEVLGKDIYGATAYYSMDEAIAKIQEKKGDKVKVVYHQASEAEFRGAMSGMGTPGHVVDDLYEMFLWIEEGKYFGVHPETGESAEDGLARSVKLVQAAMAGEGGDGLKLTTLGEYVDKSVKL